jgi:hypothetical protein
MSVNYACLIRAKIEKGCMELRPDATVLCSVLLQSDTPQTISHCNPHLKHTALTHTPPALTIQHQLSPYGTTWHHMANTAQDRHWKRYTRMHISNSLILFPKDQILSFN